MLEDLTAFLSTSSIHGLSYLPATRRLARLFWLLVVLSGFSTAAYLIVKSFRGWEESPVSTSVSGETSRLCSHWSRSINSLL